MDAEGGHKHLHRVPVAVFLRPLRSWKAPAHPQNTGRVEDAPPVMAFCLSDIYAKGIIDSFRESTGSIGFFREPFFLKSYGDGFRGGHTGGFFSDVREIFLMHCMVSDLLVFSERMGISHSRRDCFIRSFFAGRQRYHCWLLCESAVLVLRFVAEEWKWTCLGDSGGFCHEK